MERVGDVLQHPSNHGVPKQLYFGDELGEESYVKNGGIGLEFLGLGKGTDGDAVGMVKTSFDGGESYLQFNNKPSWSNNPDKMYDRTTLTREGLINVDLDTKWVDSAVDREVRSIYYRPTSGRMPGSRYTEVKETRVSMAASADGSGV